MRSTHQTLILVVATAIVASGITFVLTDASTVAVSTPRPTPSPRPSPVDTPTEQPTPTQMPTPVPSPRAAASIHCFGGPSEDARFCSAAVSINVREGRYDGPGVFGVVSGPEELPEISFNLVSEIEGVDGRRVTPNDPNVRDFRVQALHVRVELRNDRFDGPLVVPNREVVLVVNHSSERHDFTMRGEDLVLEPEESFRAEFAIPIIADGNWGWHVQTWFYPN